MSNIVVTGGSGRLGREFVVPALAKDHSITVFDAVAPPNPDWKFVEGNIMSIADLTKAFEGADAIVHLAAIPIYTGEGEEEKIWRINVDGTFNVLEAARRAGVQDIVLTSSVCAWGNIFWSKPQTPAYFPIDEDIPNRPDDMYGISKLIGEVVAYGYARRYNQRIASLRLATVGLFDQDYWIDAVENIGNPDHVLAAVANPEQPSAGDMYMSDFVYQYVDPRDVAQAFRLALKAVQEGRIGDADCTWDKFNIGAADVFSTHKSLDLIEKYYPGTEKVNEELYESKPQYPLFDIARAREVLGYNPEYTWRDFTPRPNAAASV
jgi:nucleoside-diphosphate-sugar epimerase